MKSIILLIVAGLISCTLTGQKLSSNAKAEFCQQVHKHFFSSDVNDGLYQVIIYKKINSEYYQESVRFKNNIVASICTNEKYFNLIVDATYNATGSQMLFTHLYSFLGMSGNNAIALKNYILTYEAKKKEIGKRQNIDSGKNDIMTLKNILESSKWYCTGSFYQRNGVGDSFQEDSLYITYFSKKDKSFEIVSREFGFKGRYTFNGKDSILICQINYEKMIKGYEIQYGKTSKKILFKVNFDNEKLTLSEYSKNQIDSGFDYEFVKVDD